MGKGKGGHGVRWREKAECVAYHSSSNCHDTQNYNPPSPIRYTPHLACTDATHASTIAKSLRWPQCVREDRSLPRAGGGSPAEGLGRPPQAVSDCGGGRKSEKEK